MEERTVACRRVGGQPAGDETEGDLCSGAAPKGARHLLPQQRMAFHLPLVLFLRRHLSRLSRLSRPSHGGERSGLRLLEAWRGARREVGVPCGARREVGRGGRGAGAGAGGRGDVRGRSGGGGGSGGGGCGEAEDDAAVAAIAARAVQPQRLDRLGLLEVLLVAVVVQQAEEHGVLADHHGTATRGAWRRGGSAAGSIRWTAGGAPELGGRRDGATGASAEGRRRGRRTRRGLSVGAVVVVCVVVWDGGIGGVGVGVGVDGGLLGHYRRRGRQPCD